MNLEATRCPAPEDIDFITKKLCQETAEYGAATPFAFFVRDHKNQIIAGANGCVVYGTIYTDQLWVDKGYRGQGYARQLMAKIHELGRQEGCKIATLLTMDFQGAHTFYEKFGYEISFIRDGYINDSKAIHMRCLLKEAPL